MDMTIEEVKNMSQQPLENSMNELENTSGLETDPDVTNVTDNFHRDAAVHAKLYKLLRQVVSKSVAELKVLSLEKTSSTSNEIVEAVPISFNVPEDCDNVNTMRLDTIISEAQRNTKQRSRTNLVAEISVKFKVPDDFVKNAMDMGKFSIFQATGHNNYNNTGCQFSFSERLESWKIERRQRINGRFDLYYRHERSKALFRSTIEVVNFLLYEAYPDKLKPGNDEKSEGEESPMVEKSDNTRKCSKKRPNLSILNTKTKTKTKTKENKTSDACKEAKVDEREDDKVDKKEEDKVESVEEFLDKAYKNFLNSTPTTFTYTGSFVYESDTDEEFEEFYAAFSSDHQPIDDENHEINHQTVEEFLESAYNNLLNYFNNNNNNNNNDDDVVDEPKVSSKNKRKRDEKPKKERKRSLAPSQEEKAINPKKVEANPMEVDDEASPVETDPIKIEANNIPTNLETTCTKLVEVVDNVVKAEEVEVSTLGEASPVKVVEVNHTEVVAINRAEAVANSEAAEVGANIDPSDVAAAPVAIGTNIPDVVATSPAIVGANPEASEEAKPVSDDVAAGDGGITAPVEVKANSDSVKMEEAGKEANSLVVLSSYSDQCDLINYIPLADNMFDLGIPLVNRRNGDK